MLRSNIKLALLLAGGLCLGACTMTPPDPDAASIRFKNWWNFYERGRQRMDARDYVEAKADFERALGRRPGAVYGYPVEEWRERTYGLCTIDEYFPHREAGIAAYYLGQDDEAVAYLKKSIEQESSARARYYLNLVRARLARGRSWPRPAFTLDGVAAAGISKERTVPIAGRACGAAGIQRVEINGKSQFIELAEDTLAFKDSVELHAGINHVELQARDLAGQTGTTNITILADWQPPEFFVRDVAVGNGYRECQCSLRDNDRLSRVTLNAEDLFGVPLGRSLVTFPVRVPVGKSVRIRARDVAGNELDAWLHYRDLDPLAWRNPDNFLAAAGVADAGGVTIGRGADDTAGVNQGGPLLRLASGPGPLVSFDEEFVIEGQATDYGRLSKITVNGDPTLAAGDEGAITWTFSHRVALSPGTNTFDVVAYNRADRNTQKRITIVCREPLFRDNAYRIRVAAPSVRDDQAPLLAAQVQQQIEHEFVRRPTRFNLVDRDEETLAQINLERELGSSEAADRKVVLRLNKVLTAEFVFLVSLQHYESQAAINGRLVDVSDGTRLWAHDVYYNPEPGGGLNLDEQIAGLMLLMRQEFPLVDARISKIDRNTIVIAAGADACVRRGSSFLVVRPGDDGQLRSGTIVKRGDVPLMVEIDAAGPATAQGIILPKNAIKDVRRGDWVYAR